MRSRALPGCWQEPRCSSERVRESCGPLEWWAAMLCGAELEFKAAAVKLKMQDQRCN